MRMVKEVVKDKVLHLRYFNTDHTACVEARYRTVVKAVLSDDEGMGQKAYRTPARITPGCTGESH
jgi:hypothetical protein